MGTLLTYNFGQDYDDEFTFDYGDKWHLDEAKKYILRTHSQDELISDFLEYIYPSETERNKEFFLNEYGFDGSMESIKNLDSSTKKELIEDQMIDDLLDIDLYNDELMDYFEDDAYEEYVDSINYSNDPYSYYGVRKSDF